MKAVVQRVSSAKLTADGVSVGAIGRGLVVYLGVEKGDLESDSETLARKIVMMRIFEDTVGKLNRSAIDCGYEILVVSNFTLCADCTHGNRPSFFGAEVPARADELYRKFADAAAAHGVAVKTGVFGADMAIEQINDGPVTIVL